MAQFVEVKSWRSARVRNTESSSLDLTLQNVTCLRALKSEGSRIYASFASIYDLRIVRENCWETIVTTNMHQNS